MHSMIWMIWKAVPEYNFWNTLYFTSWHLWWIFRVCVLGGSVAGGEGPSGGRQTGARHRASGDGPGGAEEERRGDWPAAANRRQRPADTGDGAKEGGVTDVKTKNKKKNQSLSFRKLVFFFDETEEIWAAAIWSGLRFVGLIQRNNRSRLPSRRFLETGDGSIIYVLLLGNEGRHWEKQNTLWKWKKIYLSNKNK